MPPRPCLTCRRPMTGPGNRHPACALRPQLRTAAETRRRRLVVAAWIAEHGNVCLGHGRAAHQVEDGNVLTADHLMPVRAGGAEDGPLTVLCRSCNSRRGAW